MFDPALIAKAQTEASDINLPTAAMNDLFWRRAASWKSAVANTFTSAFAMSTLTL
jgi:glucose-6-phosphate dehydrogenase assembly protein OpcA